MKKSFPRLETMPLAKLAPNERNPRKITPEALARLEKSLNEFGNLSPITFNQRTGKILGGHQRLKCLGQMGRTETEVWVVDLDAAKESAALLTLNNSAGEWDGEGLADMLKELQGAGGDLDLTGFTADSLADLKIDLGEPEPVDAEPQIDKAEELRKKWKVKLGQIWELGEHRLMCGDSTDRACVEKLSAGHKSDLLFTSPPYSQQRQYGGEMAKDWLSLVAGVFLASESALTEKAQVLVNLGMVHESGEWFPYWDPWIEAMRGHGWKRFGLYVWDQGHGLRGDWQGRCAPSFELIFHFNRKPATCRKWIECKHAGEDGGALRTGDTLRAPTGDKIQSHKVPDSVWRIERQKGGIEGHPAPFSVALVKHAARTWIGDLYEPFSGSGTTIIACEQLGRKCRAMEISPGYVAVAIQRWADATGKTPRLLHG